MAKLVLKRATPTATGRGVYRIAYEQELNAAQLQAVMHTEGPALVVAGAGTGKTRTLTYRVARLVEDGVDPASILLLTFTRKAAQEMIRRATALLDGRCERVGGGTFHSFAHVLLRRYAPVLGYPTTFSVLDQSDAEDVMNLVRGRFDVAALKKRFPQKATLQNIYSMSVNTAQAHDDVIAQRWPQFVERSDKIGEIIRAYVEYKKHHGLVDYDDLLLALLSMTRHDEIRPVLHERYSFMMVDEYQDTNRLQHLIVEGLAGTARNVMAVGDDAQSIYSFRGSDVKNMTRYAETFDPCTVIRLEQNYRSTQPVLNVCNAILRDAPGMFERELRSDIPDGEAPMLISCANERQQSEFVVQQILDLHEQGVPLREMSVLVRSGFLSFDLEIELGKAGIPFRKYGGMKFAEAAHVKDLLAMLRITENQRDAISWFRVLQLLEGVGQKTATATMEQLLSQPDPLFTTGLTIPGKGKAGILTLQGLLADATRVKDAGERARMLATSYKETLERRYDDHAKRWKDIETLVSICSRYDTVGAFLADIALDPPTDSLDDIEPDDRETDVVTISTIHSAKGLEWHSVFVIWVNEGRLPSARSAESEETLEEERRLLYVACTRAKQRLFLTYPAVMFEWEHSDVLGVPSRFLDGVSRDACPVYTLDVVKT